jgi:hypothetical protein
MAGLTDPWLVREVDGIVERQFRDPVRRKDIPEVDALPDDVREQTIERFRQELLNDPAIARVVHAKRLSYMIRLQARARAQDAYVPRIKDPQARAQVATLLSLDLAVQAPEALLRYGAFMEGAVKALEGQARAAAAENAAAARQTATATAAGTAKQAAVQQFQQAEQALDAKGVARRVGTRIASFIASLAAGTPQALTRARLLWNELAGSLWDWRYRYGGMLSVLRATAPATDTDLQAFLAHGFTDTPTGPVIKDVWLVAPERLRTWDAAWGRDADAVARWLYAAVDGTRKGLALSTFLSAFPDVATQEAALRHVLLGSGGARGTWCIDGERLDTLIPADDYMTGPLVDRLAAAQLAQSKVRAAAARIDTELEAVRARLLAGTVTVEAAQQESDRILQAADPWFDIKDVAVAQQIDDVGRVVANVSSQWTAVAAELTPRDPWIPLDILSAWVSHRLQFPWMRWNFLFTHPDSNVSGCYWPAQRFADPADTRKGTTGLGERGTAKDEVPDFAVTGRAWYYPAVLQDGAEILSTADLKSRPPQEYPEAGKGYLPLASYDPTEGEAVPTGIRTVHVGCVAEKLGTRRVATGKDVRRTVKWPHGGGKMQMRQGFVPWRLEVVRLHTKETERSGIFAYRTWDWTPHTLVAGDTPASLLALYGAPGEPQGDFIEALHEHNASSGRNVIGDLLLGQVAEGTKIRVPRIIPARLLQTEGDAAPTPAIRKGSLVQGALGYATDIDEESGSLGDHISLPAIAFLGYLNNDYDLYPAKFGAELTHRATMFRMFTGDAADAPGVDDAAPALYAIPWPEANGYFAPVEVPATEAERKDAEALDYVGTKNANLIPADAAAVDDLMDGVYRFSYGLLARICARVHVPKEKSEEAAAWTEAGRDPEVGSRLTMAEFRAGVPEPNEDVADIVAEIKSRYKQFRIEGLQEAFVADFRAYLEDAKRKSARERILAAYRRIWSGFVDPADVERGRPQKYVLPASQVTDEIVRWTPEAGKSPLAIRAYDYQSRIVLTLADPLRNGGLLAADVGVGKTPIAQAFLGLKKQLGHVRRPVIITPKSLRLQWWERLRAVYPDWSIAVVGLSLGRPQAPKSLPADDAAVYTAWVKALRKVYTTAGSAPGPAKSTAEKYAFQYVVDGGKARRFVPPALDALLPPDLRAVVDTERAPLPPVWLRDTDAACGEKLRAFAAGVHDVLIVDDSDFKAIALKRDEAVEHFLRAPNVRADLYRRAFRRGAPGDRLYRRLMVVFNHNALLEQDEGAEQARAFRTQTNAGNAGLWPWISELVSVPADAAEPYNSVLAEYIAKALRMVSGVDPDAGFWRQIAGDFFDVFLGMERALSFAPALADFQSLLVEEPTAWTVVFDNGPTGAYEPVPIEIDEAVIATFYNGKVPLPIPPGALIGKSKAQEEAEEAAEARRAEAAADAAAAASTAATVGGAKKKRGKKGSEAASKIKPVTVGLGVLVYPSVGVLSHAGFGPDGIRVRGVRGGYVENDYVSGRMVGRLINRSVADGGYQGRSVQVGAAAAAAAAAAAINANPNVFGVGTRTVKATPTMVQVELRGKKVWIPQPPPSASGSGSLDSIESREKMAQKFAKIPRLPYTQTEPAPVGKPTVYWEDLNADALIVDEVHNHKGLFSPQKRGAVVEHLGKASPSARAWTLEYLTSTVKRRGGPVLVLTATPAKESPLDFYNLLQYVGAPGLPGDNNVFSLFALDTPEQFISRFIRIADQVVISVKGGAHRAPAAMAYELTEFLQVLRRHGIRETADTLPTLRGRTVAVGGRERQTLKEAARSALPVHPAAFFREGDSTVRIPNFDAEKFLPAAVGNLRFRIIRGDAMGNYAIRARRNEGDVGLIIVAPPLSGTASDNKLRHGEDWAVYADAKVPLAPRPTRCYVNMDPIQEEVYTAYQRALAQMQLTGAKHLVATTPSGRRFEARSAEIFGQLGRVAMHPDLELLEARAVDDDAPAGGGDAGEDEDEEDAPKRLPAAAITDSYTYGILGGIVPEIDPYDTPQIRGAVAFVGVDAEDSSKPGEIGLNGTAPVIKPAWAQLLDVHDTYVRSLRAAMEAWTQGGSKERARAAWDALPAQTWVNAGIEEIQPEKRARKKVVTTRPTNGAEYDNLARAVSPLFSVEERKAALAKVLNPHTGKLFRPDDLTPYAKRPAADILEGQLLRSGERVTIEVMSSRTLAIADVIIGQGLRDALAPTMGALTCGTVVFVESKFFQAFLLLSLCRVSGLTHAALVETAAFVTALKLDPTGPIAVAPGDIARDVVAILDFYGIGPGQWAAYGCVHGVLATAFPMVTLPPADVRPAATPAALPTGGVTNADAYAEAVRLVLNQTYDACFGTAVEAAASISENRISAPGLRYRTARVDVPYLRLLRKLADPPKRTTFDAVEALRWYNVGWRERGTRVCVMNAQTAPDTARAALAADFNGVYAQVSPGDEAKGIAPRYAVIQAPRFDVVIGNEVAQEGIDLQTRTCRIIHADLPWTPALFIQRNGRGVRQGNLYTNVAIDAFLTLNSIDFYRLQNLERKREWLDSALDGDDSTYELSDNEAELLHLALQTVHPDDRDAVGAVVARKQSAIRLERISRGLRRVLGRLDMASVSLARAQRLQIIADLMAKELAATFPDPANPPPKAALDAREELHTFLTGSIAGGEGALQEAVHVDGAKAGGMRIYGWAYSPTYFDVVLDALQSGRRALPAPRDTSDPTRATPKPPLVEGALYGYFVFKSLHASWTSTDMYLARSYAFQENDAGKDFRAFDSVAAFAARGETADPTQFMEDAWFVPLFYGGRIGPDGQTIGIRELTDVTAYGAIDEPGSPFWQETKDIAASIVERAGAPRRADGTIGRYARGGNNVPAEDTPGMFTVHNTACISATWDEVRAWYKRVFGSDVDADHKALLYRGESYLGARHVSWMALADAAWLDANASWLLTFLFQILAAAAQVRLNRIYVKLDPSYWESPKVGESAWDELTIPFVMADGTLRVRSFSSLFTEGKSADVIAAHEAVRRQLVFGPAKARTRVAQGDALPDAAAAKATRDAAVAAHSAAVQAEKDAEKVREKAEKADTKARDARDAVRVREGAAKAKQVSAAADLAAKMKDPAIAAAQAQADAWAQALAGFDTTRHGEAARAVTQKLYEVAQADAQKAAGAEVEADAQAKAAYDAAAKELATAEAVAETAWMTFRTARTGVDEARAATARAARAVSAAEEDAILAEALDTRIILPSTTGFIEFLTRLRTSAYDSTERNARSVRDCVETWFAGIPQPERPADLVTVSLYAETKANSERGSWSQDVYATKQGSFGFAGPEGGKRKAARGLYVYKVAGVPFMGVSPSTFQVGSTYFEPDEEGPNGLPYIYRVIVSKGVTLNAATQRSQQSFTVLREATFDANANIVMLPKAEEIDVDFDFDVVLGSPESRVGG